MFSTVRQPVLPKCPSCSKATGQPCLSYWSVLKLFLFVNGENRNNFHKWQKNADF
jgi:hypothetical protein